MSGVSDDEWAGTTREIARQLVATLGGQRLNPAQRQVLIHPGHVPPGVFLLLRGLVRCFQPDGARTNRWTAFRGVLAFPLSTELALPTRLGVEIEANSELVYVPRSRLLDDPTTAHTLDERVTDWLSLQSACNGRPETGGL